MMGKVEYSLATDTHRKKKREKIISSHREELTQNIIQGNDDIDFSLWPEEWWATIVKEKANVS